MCNFLFFLWTKCSLPLRKNGKDLENYLPMGVLLGWECCPFWIARDWILRKYWALIRSGKGMLIVMALWNFRLKKRKIDKEVSRKHSSKSELCFLILLCLKMSLEKAYDSLLSKLKCQSWPKCTFSKDLFFHRHFNWYNIVCK